MCKKMYNDLCEICQNAQNYSNCGCENATFDLETKKVATCPNFKAVPKIKIKCTYECKELGKIAVVEKEVYKLPDLPWEDQKPKTKKKASNFKKPTVDEINAYCAEKGYNNVDADAFINYFDSVGWRIGKALKPMKSWKGAVANWSRQQAQYDDEKRKKENKGRLQSKPTYDLIEYEKFAMNNTEI